jgi:Xaa-Pro aminopeptidase
MRIANLKKILADENIDLALVFSINEEPDKSMVYFTGYSGLGILGVMKNRPAFLLVPEMEYEKAKKTVKDVKVFTTEKKKRLLETLSTILEKDKKIIKKIGIDETTCPVYLYKKLKKIFGSRFVDADYFFCELRSRKDDEELMNIKRACEITDSVFRKICNEFKFAEEEEIKIFIEREIKKLGGELAFPSIIASGAGSSQPHYASSRKVKTGFLMLDFGAKYKGYCSDMTRMLYLGKPKKEEIENYDLVLRTVSACENAIREKKKFSEIYALANETLGEKSKFFTHGLGHGLGLEIHERPSLNADEKDTVNENIVFTIEPGIYFPGRYGIRIEDTVVLKNKKLTVMTKSKKDLVIIKK